MRGRTGWWRRCGSVWAGEGSARPERFGAARAAGPERPGLSRQARAARPEPPGPSRQARAARPEPPGPSGQARAARPERFGGGARPAGPVAQTGPYIALPAALISAQYRSPYDQCHHSVG
ncbi:hypothetical protein GCM10017688_25380 [Streptomyces ramulosus]